jgi:hypothetical protein
MAAMGRNGDFSAGKKPFLLTNKLEIRYGYLHCIKRLAIFPSPAGMSISKLSYARHNFFIPGQGEFC